MGGRASEIIKRYDNLKITELQVIRLMCYGLNNNEISSRIGKSKRTVEGRRLQILKKLNARNTADVMYYALSKKIITLEDIKVGRVKKVL